MVVLQERTFANILIQVHVGNDHRSRGMTDFVEDPLHNPQSSWN